MKYNELIGVNQSFHSSVNLEYDLNKIAKIQSYIPTEQSVKVLGEFLQSYYYSSKNQSRATVLIGPYGRGKSHLLLVLSALTSLDIQAKTQEEKLAAKKIQAHLCKKIAAVDKEVGALAREVIEANIRTLPVIINSNSTDINQSFLIAINTALLQAGLQELLPTTYFDSALAFIDKWENDFPDAYTKLIWALKEKKINVEDLRLGLKQFDQKSYTLFCDCYPSIAAGTEFNPLTNMDVVKLYLAVSNALAEQTEYKGITIIFDEFSKFLEVNLEKSKMLNFKIIQDMAEAAARSKETQLHLTCVTHKDILDYSSSDSFKTVEGRFRKLHFVASSEQSYELIADAIVKKKECIDFFKKHSNVFGRVADSSAMTNLFSELTQDAYERKVVYGCFPLAPLSAFSLLHVSELVGQNERTLFTFLTQTEQYALGRFIEKEFTDLEWLTVDSVYDYFEELFKKEVFNASVHSVWAKTNSAIRQVKDVAQLHVLKAIAVINIIADERFKPVPAHIKAALLMDDAEFDRAIHELLKAHVLSQRDSGEYVLLTANGVDVQRSVENYVKTSLPKINICETITAACDAGFVMPRAYNDKYSMLRSFKTIYMEDKIFLAYKNVDQLLVQYPYDGVIINLICHDDQSQQKVRKKLAGFEETPQIVLCVTTHSFVYENLLKQYEAAGKLLLKNEDAHFVEELEVFKEDLQKRIRSAMLTMYSPSSEYSSFENCDGKLDVTRQVELNQAVSKICDSCYSKTPIVNNEMVNKCNLNTQNTKARNLVVAWILEHANENTIPCMEGYGPEVSIFKSAFKQTGLDVSVRVDDSGMNAVLNQIQEFIRSCEKRRHNFHALYQLLTSSPYAMRKGIIPLYIAYELRQYKENIVLYFKGKEIELSAEVLSSLNDAPESYEMLVESGTEEKDKYLDNLQTLFEKHIDAKVVSINRIYTIVKSMQNWIRSLPEYTKKFNCYLEGGERQKVEESVIVVRSELMKFEINSRELLFTTWLTKLSETENVAECYDTLVKTKVLLDRHLYSYRKELIKKLTAMFIPGYSGSLVSAMMSWYKNLPESTKTRVFDTDSNELMITADSLSSYDDQELLDVLISIFTAVSIEDWNDKVAESFVKLVSESIARINEYVDERDDNGQDGHLSISIDGIQVEKVFDADAITALGDTVLNNLKSVFEEYGDALEPDEQLAILAKLIGQVIR